MIRSSLMIAASVVATFALGLTQAQAAKVPDAIAAAVADAARPDTDKARDANRKPADTLTFSGVKPGDEIAELLPGAGYFTRIFSKIAGSSGHVYALLPAPSPNSPADMPDLAARVKTIAADANYTNITVVVEPFNELKAPVPVDLVWTSLNYHDLHNLPGVDIAQFNKGVFDSLKPGGVFIVLDHAAEAGSGARDTSTLHRIDPETVKKEVTAAGFTFVGSSDLLHDTGDAHTVKIFDPSVRGKTDQFILKFRKPKK